jgi:hypothetical protein
LTGIPILALPLCARLHRPGKGHPSCPQLAKEMLAQVLVWFPGKRFTLVGDGAYASKALLSDLDERVTFVGRLRGDAALYDPRLPVPQKGKPGPKAKKGPKLPKPREAAQKADRKRIEAGPWWWQVVNVMIYGCVRCLRAVAYEALWPWVLGQRAVRVVVVRDPEGRMRDCYLFSTDLEARGCLGGSSNSPGVGRSRYCSAPASRSWTWRHRSIGARQVWRSWRRGCGRCSRS